jgi:hypothetical protein
MDYDADGLIRAEWPTSGHYELTPMLWTTMHWTRFVKPGWRAIPCTDAAVPTGRCALAEGGNYAALASPNSADFAIVIHAFRHNTSKCIRNDPPAEWHVASSQVVQFDLSMLGAGLPTSVHAWRSCSGWVYPAYTDGWLEQLPDVVVAGGTLTVEVLADCYYTFTTVGVGGAVKPMLPAHIPLSTAFPLPYSEDFEGALVGGEAPFFGDQMGKFETVAAQGGRSGRASRQQQPVGPWPIGNRGHSQPLSIIGDMFWRDLEVSVDTLIEDHGVGAGLALRVRNPATFFRGVAPGLYLFVLATPGIYPAVNPNDPGAGGPGGVAPTPNVVMANGTGWKLCSNSYCQGTPIVSGKLPAPWNVGEWHRLALRVANESASAWLDGHELFAGKPFPPTEEADQPFNGSIPASGWAALVTTLGHVQYDNFRIDGKAVGGGAVAACTEATSTAGARVVVAPCDAPALRREWERGSSGVLELAASGGLCLGEAHGLAALVQCNSSDGLYLHDIKTGRISSALGTCLDLIEQGSHAGPPWLPAVVGQSCAPIATPAAWSQQFQFNPQTGALRPKSARCVADFLPWIPNNGYDGDQYRDCCLAVC